MIEIYADGAYNPVLGQGGWGAVIVENSQKQVFSGMAKKTTSNRMEITAALEGIMRTPKDAEVLVYTDSQYLFGCVAKGWQRRANRDLWAELDAAVGQRKVRWQWLDQDARNPYHKEAHALATNLASQGEMLRPTILSEQQKPQPEVTVVQELTHIDASGRPKMVDVTEKPATQREAVARGLVKMNASTFDRIREGSIPKGNVLAIAQVAGIMAAKQTPTLIPLCHPLLLSDIKVDLALDEANSAIEITASVKSTGKTGVEMEALTATAVAALTIYDMCKAIDRGMRIENIRLVRKSGGKSGTIVLE